ncbi:hypothetical protein AMS68_003697 [Peltaster fructicola]|uniref:Rhodopsin domain-containing protein n=1 Tax=Peltaster fructicola TaxID=286661 RepID=A0A6H0XUQ8_9PEZI|nr:hypothetical protein AMS68_003697 [Peltaster fructicola]
MDMAEHSNNATGLNLAISLCLTYTLCIVCVRLWIRKGGFGHDDTVVLVTTLFSLGHTAADYAALANGLGKPWETVIANGRLPSLNSATIAGIITFTIALYLSKIAVLAFLARITKNKLHLNIYYACAGAFAVLCFISVLLVTVGCRSGSGLYWAFGDNTNTCPGQFGRWQAFTAFDVITEIILLVLPVQLIWSLQMPLSKKAMVLTAFYLRSPVIGLTLVRNYFTLRLTYDNSDSGLDGALVVIWMEIELAYALAASTLSALKAFTESFNSGFGQGFTRARGDQYDLPGMSKGSGNSSEKRKSEVRASDTDNEHSERAEATSRPPQLPVQSWSHAKALRLRPDVDGCNETRVSADPMQAWRRDHQGSDDSRDDLFIVRETELSVHHDEAPMLKHTR